MAGAEQSRIFPFYVLAAFAELKARTEPTILVLDEPFNFLHPAMEMEILNLFESPQWTFQVVLATFSPHAYDRRHHGWSVTVLVSEGDRKSRISQEDDDVEAINRPPEGESLEEIIKGMRPGSRELQNGGCLGVRGHVEPRRGDGSRLAARPGSVVSEIRSVGQVRRVGSSRWGASRGSRQSPWESWRRSRFPA